jgi:hypothetical protein
MAYRDPFYNFGGFQRDPKFDWTRTPMIGSAGGYLEQNPEAIFTRTLARLGVGLGDQSSYAKFLRDQYRNTAAGFRAAFAEDPLLTYGQYMKKNFTPQAAQLMFNRLTPRQQGRNPGRFGGPARWIPDA